MSSMLSNNDNTKCIIPLNFIIVYYVPRQSSRCLYEDAEFNVRADGEYSHSRINSLTA